MLDTTSFGGLLARYRRRLGCSQLALAKRAGLHSTVVNRYESGERDNPTRATALALARGLGLAAAETDALLASAGYLPPSLQKLAPDDPTLASLLSVLCNDRLDPASRADFRAIVQAMAARWQGMERPANGRRTA